MSKRASFFRLMYATCAILVSLGMSCRPIPSVTAPNDTGRYVANQLQACALPPLGSSSVIHDSSVILHSAWGSVIASGNPALPLTWRAFDLLMRPACAAKEPYFFLFCTAMAIPFALLFFADWNQEAVFLVAIALLFSTVGFEFMNNALREGVALAFLLGGLFFEKRLPKVIAIVAAVILHDAILLLLPMVLMLAYRSGILKRKDIFWGAPLLLALSIFVIYERVFSGFNSEDLSEAFTRYSGTYSQESSAAFLLFIIFPFVAIFLIRLFWPTHEVATPELISFWYFTVLLLASMIIAPAGTYRIAMDATIIQAFVTMRSPRLSVEAAATIAWCLVMHFIIYAVISKSVVQLFSG